jgi:hypothetical protein
MEKSGSRESLLLMIALLFSSAAFAQAAPWFEDPLSAGQLPKLSPGSPRVCRPALLPR